MNDQAKLAEALELVRDLTAALDNVLLHQGKYMTAADREQRAALVAKAEAFTSE